MLRGQVGARVVVLAAAAGMVCVPALSRAQNGGGEERAGAAPAARAEINYDTAHLERQLQATRAAGRITLDGMLDEPSWASAPMAHNFIQNDPHEGEPATFDTEVRILYDDDALYFGVLAKDDEPDRVIVNDLKKDYNTGQSDGFRVILDTFHDGRNGYQFSTNPAGAKWDAQMSNEGRENNQNWDGIWDVSTRITETGWVAEFRIPFRTLKFTAADMQTWGMNFERKLRRFNEDSYWAPLPRVYEIERVSIAGTIDGLRSLRPGKNIRIKPYAASNSSTVGRTPTTNDFDAGLDVKYGVTSGLVWDFTVNTDFSQAEADEQQVNLTRFSLFFPEKRDFFLENSGIFQFGTSGNPNSSNPSNTFQLFFSRRIGLSDNGDAIPILGGTRLTGRQGHYSIGALSMQQRAGSGVASTNFTALRVRRDLLANSDIGAIFLNKEETGLRYNRTAGADANFRFGPFFSAEALVAKTFSPEWVDAGTGSDYGTRVGYNYRSRVWQLQSSYSTIGGRFNDEMGFVSRRGVNYLDGNYGPQLRFARFSKWMRQTRPGWEFDIFTRQSDGQLDSRYQRFHWNINFQDGTNIDAGRSTSVEEIQAPFTINSARGIKVQPGRYEFGEWTFFLNTNQARRISLNTRLSTGTFYDGYRHAYQMGPQVRINENFNASMNLQINDISLSTGDFVTKLVTTRVNYNFNTKMFLNALVQYNTDNSQWSSNLRFNIIHRPLSDFFLVYNERRDDRTGDLLNRAVIAKMTYMVAF
jgi:hypothetical protein